MNAPEAVLSLVERGWRGARQCSLQFSRRGVSVTHVVKGSLQHEVRDLISPSPLMRLVAVPRRLFPVAAWLLLTLWTARGRLRWVLVDNEGTLRAVTGWCAAFCILPVLVRELEAPSYELLVDGRVRSFADLIAMSDLRRGRERYLTTSSSK